MNKGEDMEYKKEASNLRSYLIFTYLLFWAMLVLTGILANLKVPKIVVDIMSNVDAWSPTFILLILFTKLFPGVTIKDFIKRSFGSKVKILDFLFSLIWQLLAFVLVVSAYLIINDRPVNSLDFINIGSVFSVFIITLTAGPLGEELGWRGYALGIFQKRYSPLSAALILGLLWGFWHLPLWFISGFSGKDLLIYIISFLLAIISTSILITYFYNKSRNILIAMWIHFWFNFLLKLVNIDLLPLLFYTAIAYFLLVLVLLAAKKEVMMKKPKIIVDVNTMHPASKL
jgi:membrane protease YdiL (CAAX protease family)